MPDANANNWAVDEPGRKQQERDFLASLGTDDTPLLTYLAVTLLSLGLIGVVAELIQMTCGGGAR